MNKNKFSKQRLGNDATSQDIKTMSNRVTGIIKKLKDKIEFDIEAFEETEQFRLMSKIIDILDSDEKILNIGEKQKIPNKKLIDNIAKENMDIELDKLLEEFIKDTFGKNINRLEHPEFEINIGKLNIKRTVRNYNVCELKYILEEMPKPAIDMDINYKLDEYYLYTIDGIYLIEELFLYLYMQVLIYHIIDNKNIEIEEKYKALNKLNDFIEKYTSNFKYTDIKEDDIFKAFILKIFTLERRNELKHYLKIAELLELDNEKLEKYGIGESSKYESREMVVSDLDKSELMDIVYEGKIVNEDDFKNKITKTKEIINILVNKSGRQLDFNYVQHLKCVFREIYVSKLKFNDNIAKTIVDNILSNGYESISNSDRFFLNEKISRGMYRECKCLELYDCKNSIQSKLNTVVLKIYEQNHPYGAMKDLHRALCDLAENLIDEVENLPTQKVGN